MLKTLKPLLVLFMLAFMPKGVKENNYENNQASRCELWKVLVWKNSMNFENFLKTNYFWFFFRFRFGIWSPRLFPPYPASHSTLSPHNQLRDVNTKSSRSRVESIEQQVPVILWVELRRTYSTPQTAKHQRSAVADEEPNERQPHAITIVKHCEHNYARREHWRDHFHW